MFIPVSQFIGAVIVADLVIDLLALTVLRLTGTQIFLVRTRRRAPSGGGAAED